MTQVGGRYMLGGPPVCEGGPRPRPRAQPRGV